MKLGHQLNVPKRPRAVQAELAGHVSAVPPASAVARAAQLAAEGKAALHTTIHASVRGTKAIADYAGLSYSFLANSALTSSPNQLPFSRLPLVLEACDDLTLLRFFAARQGCDVFRLPVVGVVDDVRRASTTMREFAEFVDAGAAALEDQVIEPRDFAAIEREGLEAVRAILETIAYYRARVQRPLLEGM